MVNTMQMRMRTMSLSINWKHCPSQNSNRISSGISTCLTGGSVDDNEFNHVDDNDNGGLGEVHRICLVKLKTLG